MNLVNKLKETINLFIKKENILLLLIIIIIFMLDRISKIEIINNFSENTYYINDFINFDLIWNTGIGFGLLSSDTSLIYNIVTVLVGLVILILFYVTNISENKDKFIFSIIIGGAIGNFYDSSRFYRPTL